MEILKMLLGILLFGAAVSGVAWWLHQHTLRDADRWLADRRTQVRRQNEDAELPKIERRAKLERRESQA